MAIGEKNELFSKLPGYSHRMVSEIFQESLGILLKKKKHMKNEIQSVEKRRPGSYLLYLETHVKRVVVCYMRKFCAMLWNTNLVLAVSRI